MKAPKPQQVREATYATVVQLAVRQQSARSQCSGDIMQQRQQFHDTVRYDTIDYINVRPKADE